LIDDRRYLFLRERADPVEQGAVLFADEPGDLVEIATYRTDRSGYMHWPPPERAQISDWTLARAAVPCHLPRKGSQTRLHRPDPGTLELRPRGVSARRGQSCDPTRPTGASGRSAGMSRRTTAAIWVKGIAEMLVAEGLDARQLLQAAGIDPAALDAPGARLPT